MRLLAAGSHSDVFQQLVKKGLFLLLNCFDQGWKMGLTAQLPRET